MKKLALYLFLCIIVTVTSDAQKEIRLHYGYSGFDKISVSGSYSVFVEKGDEYSITVMADEYIADFVKVGVSNKTLSLSLESGQYKTIHTLKAHVILQELTNISLAGNSGLIGEDIFTSEDFKAVVAGGATLTFNVRANNINLSTAGNSNLNINMEAMEAKITAAGGSKSHLSGKAITFHGNSAGNSQIEAPDLSISNMKLSIAGGSVINANARGELAEITVAGNSDINTVLNVSELKVSISGGSKATISGEAMKLSGSCAGNSRLDASLLKTSDINLSIAGGSRVKAQAQGGYVEAVLAGNSLLTLSADVSRIKINAMGGSEAKLSGKTETLSCSCAGNGNINAFELIASEAAITASGGCSAKVNVQKKLDAHAIGSSTITYIGNPSITSKTAGSSKVKKR